MKRLAQPPQLIMRLYPYETLTSLDVDPHKVPSRIYGHHASIPTGGQRHWHFQSKEGFDRFLQDHPKGKFK